MNGISFIQMLQRQPVTQGGLNVAGESTNDKASFFQMLNASLTEKELAETGLLKERQNKTSLGELLSGKTIGDTAFLKENDKEELMVLDKLISQLVEALSGNGALLADDVLNNPLVVDLLEQLSDELQLELQVLFEGNDSLKSLLEQGEGYLNSPVQLLAVVIGFVHNQNQAQVTPETKIDSRNQAQVSSQLVAKISDQATEKLQIQLEKLLAMLTKSEQHPLTDEKIRVRDFQEVVKQLTSSLQVMSTNEKQKFTQNVQTEKQSGKEAQFVLSAFSRITADQLATVNQGIVLPSAQGGQLNSVQQFVIHVGENRESQPNNEQILRQFQNILSRSSLAQFPNGVNQLTIKLYPEHLGRLDVKLTQQNGIIVAQLMTTTNAARTAIESQLHQLKEAFVAQNIPVDKIEISTQQQQQQLAGQSDKENQEGKNQKKPNQEQQQSQDTEDEVINFEDFLETFNVKV